MAGKTITTGAGDLYLAGGDAIRKVSLSTQGVSARDHVQGLYVAYYGRPADPAGLEFWAALIDAAGGSLDAITDAFGDSEEFHRRYPGLGPVELVTEIYRQTLGRDPDPAGREWYVGELIDGRKTLETIALDVLYGAVTAPDVTVVANKLEVAAYYTARVAVHCVNGYGTDDDGVEILTGVTADPATVVAAKVAIESWCGPVALP